MIKIKTIFTFLLLCYTITIHAQKKMTKRQFITDSVKIMKPKLVRPQFRFDNRLTFLNGQRISISGVDAGVLLKNKLRVTFGYYWASDQPTSLKKILNDVEYKGRFDLKYGALNMEFIYLNKRFFSLGMPVEFGIGSNSLYYKSEANNLLHEKQSGVLALSYFGLSATFKPIRWIGLKAAVGYRKTLYNKVKQLSYDGIYTSVGLAVDFREIITDYRMYKLKKRYRKNSNSVETAVDLITD